MYPVFVYVAYLLIFVRQQRWRLGITYSMSGCPGSRIDNVAAVRLRVPATITRVNVYLRSLHV